MPGPRFDRTVRALALGIAVCGVAAASGAPLAGGPATSLACLMLLVCGLPHGTLDLELIKASGSDARLGLPGVLAIYLGCALAMFMLWQVAPVLALGAFILIATVHFSEDWRGTGSALLELGLALALLSAPTLRHRDDLDDIFVALTGRIEASVVTDLLTLVVPVAMMIATVAIGVLWTSDRRTQAVAGALSVGSMIVFPPIVGFALFFCIFHSPHHLAGSLHAIAMTSRQAVVRIVLPLTLAAATIALGLYAIEARGNLASGLVAASFMTLSILTAPHMIAPMLIARLQRRFIPRVMRPA